MGNDDGDLRRELESLRVRYETMVEQAREAIVTLDVHTQRFTEVNRAACELFGYDRGELLQRGPVDVSEVTQAGRSSEAVARAQIERALAGEFPSFDWVHRSRSGERIPCRVHLAYLPGERALVRGTIWDLRALRSAERERNQLRALAEITPDFIGMADAQGHAFFLNPAGRRLVGLSLDDDITQMKISEFQPPDSAALVYRTAIPEAIEHGVWRGEAVVVHRDGTEIPVDQTVLAHFDDQGELEYLSTIMRDRRAALAAEQLERKVQHAQKLESLGLMAGAIAHDFNNILVGVLANASLLGEMCSGDPKLVSVTREITRAANRAAELAKGMLDYSGHSRRQTEPVELGALLEELAPLVTASISKKVRLRTELPVGLPCAWADAGQLRQVLLNLVLNAADAISEDAGAVVVRAAVVPISSPRSSPLHDHRPPDALGPWIRVDVEDDGCGMDAALLSRVFDPFYTTREMGRGLGLASVLGIVRGHQGAIDVDTELGRGTRFSVYLPMAPEAAPRARAEAAPVPLEGTGRRILVVDDEAAVRTVVRRCLTRLGFEVVEATGAAEALNRFGQAPEAWHAVVLDLTMPEMSGTEVLARILAVRPGLPVLLSSGYRPPDSVAGLGERVAFLPKPFSLQALQRALAELIPPAG